MIIYSAIMFVAAALFFLLAAAVYRGNTNLIHSYHQIHVKEEERMDYGKAFSKGLLILALSLAFSGLTALLGETAPVALLSLGVLAVGMVAAFSVIARVQKKYNGGF